MLPSVSSQLPWQILLLLLSILVVSVPFWHLDPVIAKLKWFKKNVILSYSIGPSSSLERTSSKLMRLRSDISEHIAHVNSSTPLISVNTNSTERKKTMKTAWH